MFWILVWCGLSSPIDKDKLENKNRSSFLFSAMRNLRGVQNNYNNNNDDNDSKHCQYYEINIFILLVYQLCWNLIYLEDNFWFIIIMQVITYLWKICYWDFSLNEWPGGVINVPLIWTQWYATCFKVGGRISLAFFRTLNDYEDFRIPLVLSKNLKIK